MEELFPTSDIITYVLCYNRAITRALRRECNLSLTQYRILAYLSDHPTGARPTDLARTLELTPAMITMTMSPLESAGLVKRYDVDGSARPVERLTRAGVNRSRDADTVLVAAHDEYFSPLPANLRSIVESGSTITNIGSALGNRVRDGHFFAAFETLHAFSTVERLLTISTKQFGLPVNGFRIAFELDQADGPLSPGAIGSRLLLSASTLSYSLDKLRRAGIVTQTPSKLDRRSDLCELTAYGAERCTAMRDEIRAMFMTGIRHSEPAERSAYRDAASIIVSSLRRQSGKASSWHRT